MAETIVAVPAAELDRLIYVAIAGARDDAETDLLAGLARYVVERQPEVSAAVLRSAIMELRDAIDAHRPARANDLARNSSLLMSRLLTRVVPVLVTPLVREAARDYTRAFFRSHRAGTALRRQVAPLDLQFDQFGQVERFRREIWRELYDQARAGAAVAEAVDSGPIAESLGVQTTQHAVAMLDVTGLEPLRQFVLDRIQPDGGIIVARQDLDDMLASGGATMTGLAGEYAANMRMLNTAQQDNEEGTGTPEPLPDPEEDSDFEKAIKEAEKKQKELDEILDKAAKGVKGVFGALSYAATLFGDDDLATSIDEYATILAKMVSATRDFAEAAISVAKAIEKLDEVTFDQILLGAGIGFNVAIIAVAIRLSGLLGKSKPPTQVILEQLQEIRKQIVALRDEMRVRFDRIEKRLNKMYLGLLDQLAEMDFDLGQIEGNVDELQVALYDLHAELQRLATDLHAFLEAANRRDLIEAINGSLGFRERTGEDLSLEDFRDGRDRVLQLGQRPRQGCAAGRPGRARLHRRRHPRRGHRAAAGDERQLPARVPGRAARAPAAVRGADGQPVRLDRRGGGVRATARGVAGPDGVGGPGTGTRRGRRGARQQPVQDHRLRRPVRRTRRALPGLVGHAAGGDRRVRGRVPGRRGRPAARASTCSVASTRSRRGTRWTPASTTCGVVTVARSTSRTTRSRCRRVSVGFDYSALRPLMIASNLSGSKIVGIATGLSELTSCVSARWDVQEVGTGPGPNVRVVYRLHFTVNIRYGSTLVFQHAYETAETMQLLVPRTQFENGTFDPASRQDPHALLVGTKNLWAKIDTFPATHGVLNASAIAATAALVQAKLVLLQRAFYAQVSQRFVRAGDPIQRAGQVLDGSKLIWQAYVTAGLPLRIEANETLRSLLYGSDAILSGSDAEGADSLLDDVQDLYAFFSGRTEDPPADNIAARITTLALDRAGRLTDLLAEIVRDIERDRRARAAGRLRADPAAVAAAHGLIGADGRPLDKLRARMRRAGGGAVFAHNGRKASIRPNLGRLRAQRTRWLFAQFGNPPQC